MNETLDHELDERLRRGFDAAVDDDGFTSRVMQALPPRRRRPAWPLPAAAAVGGLLAWLSLASSGLLELAAREWLAAEPGAPLAFLMALVVGTGLLACAWALEEGP
jgi:hypothetical protein